MKKRQIATTLVQGNLYFNSEAATSPLKYAGKVLGTHAFERLDIVNPAHVKQRLEGYAEDAEFWEDIEILDETAGGSPEGGEGEESVDPEDIAAAIVFLFVHDVISASKVIKLTEKAFPEESLVEGITTVLELLEQYPEKTAELQKKALSKMIRELTQLGRPR